MKKTKEVKPKEKFVVPENFPQALAQTVFIYENSNINTTLASGLIIPAFNSGKQGESTHGRGVLYAVGPDVKQTVIDPITKKVRKIRPGDWVIFNHYADKSIVHEGKMYLIMSEYEVYAFLPLPKEQVILMKNIPSRKRAVVAIKEQTNLI